MLPVLAPTPAQGRALHQPWICGLGFGTSTLVHIYKKKTISETQPVKEHQPHRAFSAMTSAALRHSPDGPSAPASCTARSPARSRVRSLPSAEPAPSCRSSRAEKEPGPGRGEGRAHLRSAAPVFRTLLRMPGYPTRTQAAGQKGTGSAGGDGLSRRGRGWSHARSQSHRIHPGKTGPEKHKGTQQTTRSLRPRSPFSLIPSTSVNSLNFAFITRKHNS